MEAVATGRSHRILFFNTLAFTVCFAVWTLNGVLVSYLVENRIFRWTPIEIGWLLGIPILTGSIFRLPIGMLADKYGGKWVFGILLFICSVPMYFLSTASGFTSFAFLSFGFGLSGTSFAVGIANTSVWYPNRVQGTVLGIFGMGNAGAALTTLLAPTLLNSLTNHGADLENWRYLPKIYALSLLIMGVLFLLFTDNKVTAQAKKTYTQMLAPLKDIRVWRFGLYYFLVFGCFVAFSQWLVPYFVNVYSTSLVTAGLLASLFSFPSGVIRMLGGWLSDKIGARKVMYSVLGLSFIFSLFLCIPKMEVFSPGKGVMSHNKGTVTFVCDSIIKVDDEAYSFNPKPNDIQEEELQKTIFPKKHRWNLPIVKVGDKVVSKQLLAKGFTRINFEANVWIFAAFVFLIGMAWGIAKAAVYKHIPDYFPDEVGVVGGMVGLLGGLGGFICPIVFGYLLEYTGLWVSSWMFIFLLTVICLWWMNRVVHKET